MREIKEAIPAAVPALLAVLGGLAWSQPRVGGADLWWHLASGRAIWTEGRVLKHDPFSFTFAGHEWMNHEWGWDLVAWGFYRLDPQLVAWSNLALVGAVLWLAYAEALRQSGSRIAAVIAVWLGAATAHWFFDIRPHVITLAFVGILLLSRDRAWAPWIWAPLMMSWVNLHAGFVFGFGAIALYVLVRTGRSSVEAGRLELDRSLVIGVTLAGLAILVNPWGYRIFEYPLAYLVSDSPYRTIHEWAPTPWDLDVRDYAGRFWAFCAICVPGVVLSWRRRPYLISLATVAFLMAVTSRRFIPLFIVVATPLPAVGFAALVRLAARARPSLAASRPLAWLAAGVAAVFVSTLWNDVRFLPNLLARWTLEDQNPRAALRYLRALEPGPRLLNYYNWGGYVMLHEPGFRTAIDGRANTLYDADIYRSYVALLDGGKDSIGFVRALKADAALLPASRRDLIRMLTGKSLGWRVVYRDRRSVVLLPPDSRALEDPPEPSETVGSEAQLLQWSGLEAYRRGELALGRGLVERALAADPLLADAYGSLAQGHALDGDLDSANASIERGIAALPRRSAQLRETQANFLLGNRELAAALEAARLAVPTGPFANPTRARRRIERIERRIAEGL